MKHAIDQKFSTAARNSRVQSTLTLNRRLLVAARGKEGRKLSRNDSATSARTEKRATRGDEGGRDGAERGVSCTEPDDNIRQLPPARLERSRVNFIRDKPGGKDSRHRASTQPSRNLFTGERVARRTADLLTFAASRQLCRSL